VLFNSIKIKPLVEAMIMKKGTWWMVMVLFALLSQAQAALVISNGDFELWTAGIPDGWSKGGPVTLAQSSLLDWTSSVRLTSLSNNQS
jgi:hypothetical protein